MDIKSKAARSRNMSAIKNKNTSIELMLRKSLWEKGLRYRVVNTLPGKPDIICPKQKIAIFCDGCFWHHCPKCAKYPEQNKDFWFNKINKNIERDTRVSEDLRKMDWKVLRYWECDIKNNVDEISNGILKLVKQLSNA